MKKWMPGLLCLLLIVGSMQKSHAQIPDDGEQQLRISIVSINDTYMIHNKVFESNVLNNDRYRISGGNFTLPNGKVVSVLPGLLSKLSEELFSLELTVTQLPQHGELVWENDGNFRYTPDPDFAGKDSFEYNVHIEGEPEENYSRASVEINVIGTYLK